MTYNKINIESATEEVSQFKLKMAVLLLIAMLTIFITILVFCPAEMSSATFDINSLPTTSEVVVHK